MNNQLKHYPTKQNTRIKMRRLYRNLEADKVHTAIERAKDSKHNYKFLSCMDKRALGLKQLIDARELQAISAQ